MAHISAMTCRSFAIFAVACTLACSSSESTPTPAPTDSAIDTPVDAPAEVADARKVDVAGDGPISPILTCGAGPYRSTSVTLYEGGLHSRGAQVSSVSKVTFSACPEASGSTDPEGYADVRLTLGVATSARVDVPGHLPTRWPEVKIEAWTPGFEWTVLPDSAKAQLPELAGDKGVILVSVLAAGSTGYCGDPDNVTLSVEGHPEAIVTYRAAAAPYSADTSTSTTASGLATISGLASGTRAVVKATKASCVVDLAFAPGATLVEGGVVSMVPVVVRDAGPACGPPPYVQIGGVLLTRELDGTPGKPLLGGEVTFSGCAGVTSKTAFDGTWSVYVSQGMPVFMHYSLLDYISVNAEEESFAFSTSALSMSIRKRDTWLAPDLMPGFDDTHGFISLGIGFPKTGACSKPDGVVISVKGQPEAKVIYTVGEPPKSTGGTSTSTRGSAYVSGLKPGILAVGDVSATKAGCTLSAPGTGRAVIGAGELTLYSFQMK